MVVICGVNSNKYFIRKADDNEFDYEQFELLHQTVFHQKIGRKPFRTHFFDLRCPATLCLALSETSTAIAAYASQIFSIVPGSINVAMSTAIMVNERYRGKGIISKLMDYSLAEVAKYSPVMFGVIANQAGAVHHVNRMQWKKILDLPSLICPAKIFDLEFGKQFNAYCMDSGRFFRNWNLDGIPKDFSKGITSSRFFFSRTEQYLRWRYQEEKYTFFVACLEEVPVGYIVVKKYHDQKTGMLFGDIVDVVGEIEKRNLWEFLLATAMNYFARLGVQYVALWSQEGSILFSIATQMGFFPSGEKRYFCGTVIDSSYNFLLDSSRWVLNMADSVHY